MSKNISPNKKPRVVIAMSGGVDSSVAAYLLKEQKYEVIGIFLKLWQPDYCSGKHRQNLCCDDKAMGIARQIADKLEIPFYVLKVDKLFKKEIVDNFVSEYEQGRTPNPCVRCNKYIKFGYLWEKAKGLGADSLATGHYIKTGQYTDTGQLGSDTLCRSKDLIKDQTYFLSTIDTNVIPHLLFPLGNMTKKEVRAIAKKAKLPVYNKRDSMGVCFIPDGDTDSFLRHFSKKLQKSGEIVDKYGNLLGHHAGLLGYTMGQKVGDDQVAAEYYKLPNYPECYPNIPNGKFQTPRKEFGTLGTNSGKLGKKDDIPRLYVIKIDPKKNRLIIGENEDCFSDTVIIEDVNIMNDRFWEHVEKNGQKPKAKSYLYAQIRGGHKAERCIITNDPNRKSRMIPNGKSQTSRKEFGTLGTNSGALGIRFLKPVRAITPGQTIALYEKDVLIGGGIIK